MRFRSLVHFLTDCLSYRLRDKLMQPPEQTDKRTNEWKEGQTPLLVQAVQRHAAAIHVLSEKKNITRAILYRWSNMKQLRCKRLLLKRGHVRKEDEEEEDEN